MKGGTEVLGWSDERPPRSEPATPDLSQNGLSQNGPLITVLVQALPVPAPQLPVLAELFRVLTSLQARTIAATARTSAATARHSLAIMTLLRPVGTPATKT